MIRRSLQLTLVCGLALISTACVTNRVGEGGGVTPDGHGEQVLQPEGGHTGDSWDELTARLGKLVEQQKSLHSAAAANAGVCEDICSLATSICGVQEKLCSIADRRPSDEEYQGLCREAKQECRAAQEDCISCVEKHSSGDAEPAPDGDRQEDGSAKPEAEAAAQKAKEAAAAAPLTSKPQ